MEEKENEKLINKDKRMYWRKKQKKLALRKLGYGLTRFLTFFNHISIKNELVYI